MNQGRILKDHEYMRRFIEGEGVKLSFDPDALMILKRASLIVFNALRVEIGEVSLCLIGVYDMGEQTPGSDTWSADGVTYYTQAPDGRTIYGVLLSTQAIMMGADYLLMVLIHELEHIRCRGDYRPNRWHTERFENQLNDLLRVFQDRTGMRLVNDYAGYGES